MQAVGCGNVGSYHTTPLPSPHGACTMTTTTTKIATAAETILALDLGKYKSVACLYRSADDKQFTTIATSRAHLTQLFARHQPAVVLIEACLLCGWVRDLCLELGVRCLVANTTSEAWKFKHLKRKTDRDDALRLAEVYLLGKFPSVAIPEKEVREKRALIEHRQKLVGRRVALQNRIRAILVSQGLAAPVGVRAWSEIGLAGIAAYARPIAECSTTELWRGRLHLTLAELGHVQELLDQAEKKLDDLAKTGQDGPGHQDPRHDSRRRAANRRNGRCLLA